jgi:deoxyribose-phosphate aldolase
VGFAKTSTGFNGTGATVEAVKMLRQFLHPEIKIKASGGIRDKAFAQELITAGADRIGASKSLDLI